jgi:hypothetical protein
MAKNLLWPFVAAVADPERLDWSDVSIAKQMIVPQ